LLQPIEVFATAFTISELFPLIPGPPTSFSNFSMPFIGLRYNLGVGLHDLVGSHDCSNRYERRGWFWKKVSKEISQNPAHSAVYRKTCCTNCIAQAQKREREEAELRLQKYADEGEDEDDGVERDMRTHFEVLGLETGTRDKQLLVKSDSCISFDLSICN
jgi:hypothetical protein